MPDKSRFWNFAKKEDKTGELYLYGEISSESWYGDEVTPMVFQKELEDLGDISTLNVYINSPGGDVFAGWAIISILNRCKAEKIGHNDGLCASIAFDLLMHMDTIRVSKNSLSMTHNCWSAACGNRNYLREVADRMEKIDGLLCADAAKRAGITPEEMQAINDAETWFTGEQMVEKGFADELVDGMQLAACLDGDYIVLGKERYEAKKHFEKSPPLPKYIATTQNANQKKTDNGGESQPAADNPEKDEELQTQCDYFDAIRKKFLEVK